MGEEQTRMGSTFFWLAFSRSANGMVLLRLDRTIIEINAAGVAALGRERDEIVGRHAENLVQPSQWPRLNREWEVLLRTGYLSGRRDLIRPDNRTLSVQFAAVRERVTGQDLVLWVVIESHLQPLSIHGSTGASGAELTPRELQVVCGIAMGERVHEIAARLFLSPATVQTHVRRAMHKLGARSQAQLVAIAIGSGQVDPEIAMEHVGAASDQRVATA